MLLAVTFLGLPAAAALVLVPLAVRAAGVQGAAYSMGAVAGIGVLAMAVGLRRHVDVPWAGVFVAPTLALAAASAGDLDAGDLELASPANQI